MKNSRIKNVSLYIFITLSVLWGPLSVQGSLHTLTGIATVKCSRHGEEKRVPDHLHLHSLWWVAQQKSCQVGPAGEKSPPTHCRPQVDSLCCCQVNSALCMPAQLTVRRVLHQKSKSEKVTCPTTPGGWPPCFQELPPVALSPSAVHEMRGGAADRRGARGPLVWSSRLVSILSDESQAQHLFLSVSQRMGKLRAGMSGGTCCSSKLVTSRDWLCLWLCPRLQRLLTLAQGLRAQSTRCPLPADSGPLPQLPYDVILCCHFLT